MKINEVMFTCKLYSVFGPGSRTIVSTPQTEIDIALTQAKASMRKKQPKLYERTLLGSKQVLK